MDKQSAGDIVVKGEISIITEAKAIVKINTNGQEKSMPLAALLHFSRTDSQINRRGFRGCTFTIEDKKDESNTGDGPPLIRQTGEND